MADDTPDVTITYVQPSSGSPPPTAEDRFTPGTVLSSRYRIIAPLGAGGMGEVYRAEDLKLGQQVALKFISRRIASDPEVLERVVGEVRIGRQVSHPNVCRIYDIGEVGEHHFITMEYVDGEDLASLLRRIGRLPDDKALDVARGIAAGLAAAHDKGVIHRDLKPSNVMIDGRGRPRITDFGLAFVSGQSPNVRAGSPPYMAPEQLEGEEASELSDIYSLGLMMYELFTGQRLFSGSVTEIVNAHANPKPRPSSIVRGMNATVERIIVRCIEEDATDRPDSVREILAELPGGDPLDVVIAAGETPSPRVVAAAPAARQLTLREAWTYFALTLLIVAAVVASARFTMLYKQVPLQKSPDALTEHAREVIRAAGHPAHPEGARRWFSRDSDLLKSLAINATPEQRRRAFAQFSPVRFGYRESPLPLAAHMRGALVNAVDPPLDVPGMVTVIVDSSGNLVRFARLPFADEASHPNTPVDWAPFFAHAGLRISAVAPDDAAWVSPIDEQEKRAWTGATREPPYVRVAVHAAAFAGKPVFFEVTPAHAAKFNALALDATPTEQFTGLAAWGVIFTGGLLLGIFVLRRNLRLGRVDRGGAWKVTLFVGICLLIAGFLSSQHTKTPELEWGIVLGFAGAAVFNAAAMWVFYASAEPYVRRRQPKLLISWNRVLAGRFRDPLVGRDMLHGCALGALMHFVYAHLIVLIPMWLGMNVPLPNHTFPEKLAGGVWPFVSLASVAASVPLQCVGGLFIFSVVRSVLKSDVIAAATLVVVGTLMNIGRDMGSAAEVPFVALAALVFVITLWKLGLFAAMVTLFYSAWLNSSVFVLEPSSWLFVPTLIYLVVIIAIPFHALTIAAGPQPIFGRLRLAD
jgi:serine/threonine-protein kinase